MGKAKQIIEGYNVWIPVEAWYQTLCANGGAYGSDLVLGLNCNDASALAGRILKALEAEGYISRVAWRPSAEQQAFGVGGMTIQAAEKYAKDFHAECWLWAPANLPKIKIV